ncbi:LytR C-terminal domain-containing protein [Leucobacter coleopterorum]|uniref:LytR C-terminal domain-containing protein n=1 Tax=Leucobacter coleopterorum TaxID=2714933 RepID=UPI001FCB067C|nr:LytR C-terminal domain-containing protein [Leucobacter coleopterorum]
MAQTPADPQANRRTRTGHPEDRFDRVERSGRVGAHRVAARPRYFWQYLIAALLGFALLTTAGIFALQSIGNVEALPLLGNKGGATGTQKPATAKVDPEATVAILNGTPTENLAGALEKIIPENNWGKVVYAFSADKSDVKISAVFYRDAADQAAAAGLAAKLGGISTYFTEDYGNYGARLIVLIGEDYAGPGLEEAKKITAEEGSPISGEPQSDSETGSTIDPMADWETDPNTGMLINPDTGELVDPNAAPAQ